MSRKSAKHAEPEAEEEPVTAEIATSESSTGFVRVSTGVNGAFTCSPPKAEEAPLTDAEAAVALQAAVMSASEVDPPAPADPIARVRELEDAIRRHRETAWKVHGPHRLVDRALYEVLAIIAPVRPSA